MTVHLGVNDHTIRLKSRSRSISNDIHFCATVSGTRPSITVNPRPFGANVKTVATFQRFFSFKEWWRIRCSYVLLCFILCGYKKRGQGQLILFWADGKSFQTSVKAIDQCCPFLFPIPVIKSFLWDYFNDSGSVSDKNERKKLKVEIVKRLKLF